MKKTIAVTALVSLLFSNQLLASDCECRCGILHIQIANETGVKCTLKDFSVLHGAYESYPPMSIMNGDSKYIDMDIFGYGPDVQLSYDCGGKVITLSNQMNRAVFQGQMPRAKVLYKDEGIDAQNQVLSSSCFRGQPGVINWTLNSTP